jgi:hypothetical protein
MNASTHEVRSSRTATPVLVQAVEPVPGLFVYEQPEELRKVGEIHLWRLGHYSGLVIAKFEHQADAEAAAERIAAFADWRGAAAELRADDDLANKVYRVIVYDTPGVFQANPDPVAA